MKTRVAKTFWFDMISRLASRIRDDAGNPPVLSLDPEPPDYALYGYDVWGNMTSAHVEGNQLAFNLWVSKT